LARSLQSLELVEHFEKSIGRKRDVPLIQAKEFHAPSADCGWNSRIYNCAAKIQIQVAEGILCVQWRVQYAADE
jgi:hypothetical protein